MASNAYKGAILTGGQSTRMGAPKGGILLEDGRALLHHQLDLLQTCCPQVVLLGHTQETDLSAYPNVKVIPDLTPGQGPLSGLQSLFERYPDQPALILACDQPLLTGDALQALLDQVTPEADITAFETEDFVPFPAVYHPHLLPRIVQRIQAGQRSVKGLFQAAKVHKVPLPHGWEETLVSINTPQQRDAILALRVRQTTAELGSIEDNSRPNPGALP